jgi:hypothetical protein
MRLVVVVVFVSLLALPCDAPSQMIELYNMQLDGTGGLMLDGVEYKGDIVFGMVGTWTLEVDDSLWPDASDTVARFDYIWKTFFAASYDTTAGQESWRGYFDGSTLPSVPRLTLHTDDPGGELVSNASFVVLMRDYNGDGVLSQSEKHHTCQLSMTCSVETPPCTGHFYDYCGNGSLGSGNFNFTNAPSADTMTLVSQFKVWYCGTPVSRSSWGAIKARFD